MPTTTVDRPESWSALTPNSDVFVAVLAHIEEFPEHHDQGPWRCGTSMCFGGWATQVVGFQWKTKTSRSTEVVVPLSVVPMTDDPAYDPVRLVAPDGELATVDCMHAAMIALGIDAKKAGEDGTWIFDATNSLPKLYELSAKILGISERTLKRKVKKYRAEHKFRDYVKKPKTLTKRLRWRRRANG